MAVRYTIYIVSMFLMLASCGSSDSPVMSAGEEQGSLQTNQKAELVILFDRLVPISVADDCWLDCGTLGIREMIGTFEFADESDTKQNNDHESNY